MVITFYMAHSIVEQDNTSFAAAIITCKWYVPRMSINKLLQSD